MDTAKTMLALLHHYHKAEGLTNYGTPTPSIWNLVSKDASREDLRLQYERDMARHGYLNKKIPSRGVLSRDITRIASYNIHFLSNTDATSPNVEPIVNVIKAIEADVWCFQEMLIPSSRTLRGSVFCKTPCVSWKHASPYSSMVDSFSFKGLSTVDDMYSGEGTGWGVGIAAGEMMQFTDPEAVVLEGLPRDDGSNLSHDRGYVLVHTAISGVQVIIVSVHLDVFDKTGVTRKNQLDVLLKHLDRFADLPVFILGDLNCLRRGDYITSDERGWIENNSRGGVDFSTIQQLESYHIGNTAGTYSHLADLTFVDLFATTFPTHRLPYTVWSGRRVDYIYVRCPPTFKVNVHGLYVYYDSASDHLPLIADLTITRESWPVDKVLRRDDEC